MRRLIGFLLNIVIVALCFVAVTVGLMIFDGLNDVGDHADAALVVGQEDGSSNEPQVARAVRLFKDGELHVIILCAPSSYPSYDAQASMMKYLEEHKVPSSAIIEDSGAQNMAEMAHDVDALMREHQMTSIMIVTDYYRMTRLKFALLHTGISDIAKSHVGSAKWQDVGSIAREVCALYDYIFHTYLMPAAEKFKQEAASAADKASQQAEKAKDSVNKKLDSLPK